MATIPPPYCGKDVETFAYVTIKDRLPTILVKAMDCFLRTWSIYLKKKLISCTDEEKSCVDLQSKAIVAQFSRLRYELVTNKPIVAFNNPTEELKLWNRQLAEVGKTMVGEVTEVTWFEGPWLFVEAYMYRRMRLFFERSNIFNQFDPFDVQKRDALKDSLEVAKSLAKHLSEIRKSPDDRRDLETYLEMSLWGNKCDLSFSNGVQTPENQSQITDLAKLRKNILHNDLSKLVDHLMNLKNKTSKVVIAIVMDNAGFELFTDLCMAEVLTRVLPENTEIRFHVKNIPWFVSDTMKKDFLWLVNYLANYEESSLLQKLASKWLSYLSDRKWVIVEEQFWTLGYDFSRMKDVDEKLYKQLGGSDVALFKGDLNYRKLTGDLIWPHTTPFKTALRGFEPTNICSLRTIKADVVAGLASDQVYANLPQNWRLTGEYGLVQLLMV